MSIVYVSVLVDLIAISVVVSIYFHRHQRRDLLLAYAALNSGVLAVTAMLSAAPVGAGLGLGLFGILSIIRLRSDSITQEEIAYYFVALALGLVCGLHPGSGYEVAGLASALVVVMYVGDHPGLFPRARHLVLVLDAAIPDEDELRRHLEDRLGVSVRRLVVQQLDFVRDITVVDLRCRRVDGNARVEVAPSPVGVREERATVGNTLVPAGGLLMTSGPAMDNGAGTSPAVQA
jgi:hypothetical protein